jgi:hypothetical protein
MNKKSDLKWMRVIALLIAGLTLALSIYAYIELRFLGFPDGFLTELERSQSFLVKIFIGINIPTSIWFSYLSFAAPPRIHRKLGISIALYGIFGLILFAINVFLRQYLNDGGGG